MTKRKKCTTDITLSLSDKECVKKTLEASELISQLFNSNNIDFNVGINAMLLKVASAYCLSGNYEYFCRQMDEVKQFYKPMWDVKEDLKIEGKIK